MKRYKKVSASRTADRKRRITAAKELKDIHLGLDNLEWEAYRAGYDVYAQGDSLENVTFEFVAREHTDIMPKITGWLDNSELQSKGLSYFEFKVKFPELDTRNFEFYDSAGYIVDKFADVSKFITEMLKSPIDISLYEEYYEED